MKKNNLEPDFKLLKKEDGFKPFFVEKVMSKIEEQEQKRFSIIEMLEHKLGSYRFFLNMASCAALLLLCFWGFGYLKFENEKVATDVQQVADFIYPNATSKPLVGYKENSEELMNGILFHSEFIENRLMPSETQCGMVREIILEHTKNNHSLKNNQCENRYNILRSMKDAIMPLLDNTQREKFIYTINETEKDCC